MLQVRLCNDSLERGNMSSKPNPLPKFIDMFSATAPQIASNALDAEIERRLGVLRTQQGPYQPVYGIDSDQDSPRRDLLLQNCDFVERHFSSIRRKQQVRILDVGSNAGFVTFTLAKTFPQILGMEINPAAHGLCTLLAQKMKSPARFATVDILKMIDSGDVDFENTDCVLLFNVVHQMIFARGLSYVQTAIKKIVQSVDVVFVELATRDQYVPHKKDHLLPVEAEEVLKRCVDCDIQLLRTSPRPLYLIRRRSLSLAADRFAFDSIKFSGNANSLISRKYYLNGSEFLKVYRFTPEQPPIAFEAEVQGLLAAQGTNVCPEIIDWGKNQYTGYIRMERIYGEILADQMFRHDTKEKRDKVIAELLRLACELIRGGTYQNDFSAHNIIVTSDGSLRLIDFEQARSHPIYDPFAFLLWLISDLCTGRADWYEKDIVEKLRLKDSVRADHDFYPDRKELAGAGLNSQFIEDAFSATNWTHFVKEWYPKFRDLSERQIVKTE
jgi:predicted Ser/Thr protein kinase